VLRFLGEMARDRDECVRRLREGYEFFRFFAQRSKAAH